MAAVYTFIILFLGESCNSNVKFSSIHMFFCGYEVWVQFLRIKYDAKVI